MNKKLEMLNQMVVGNSLINLTDKELRQCIELSFKLWLENDDVSQAVAGNAVLIYQNEMIIRRLAK